MSFTPIIDVAIGLILVFLLLGLISSAVQEIAFSYLKLRGKLLRDAIAELVGGGDKTAQLFTDVFHHPLIRSTAATDLPSYLPSRTFALSLIDALTGSGQLPVFSQIEQTLTTLPPGRTRESLTVLVRDAAGDMDALKLGLATWFDDAMDRVSGVYKRYSQVFAVVLGATIAVGLNVNAITVADRLWYDQNLRNQVVTAAQAVSNSTDVARQVDKSTTANAADSRNAAAAPPATLAADAQPATGKAPADQSDKSAMEIQTARSDLANDVTTLNDLALPIGWDSIVLCPKGTRNGLCSHQVAAVAGRNSFLGAIGYWLWAAATYLWGLSFGALLVAVAGWGISAVATSLGAPFWFDMLKNVLNLRGAGPKPAKADGAGGD